jgi:cell division initiation protein
MKITPIDVQQQSFKSKFRGLDPVEVASYLELVASEMEEIIAENRRLKDEIALRDREITQYKERESAIKATMLAAQKATDELRDQAKREAEILINEAELKAEKILQNAHERMVAITEELGDLKRQKMQFQESLRGIISAHSKLLALNDELAEEARRNDNVTYLNASKNVRFDGQMARSAVSAG